MFAVEDIATDVLGLCLVALTFDLAIRWWDLAKREGRAWKWPLAAFAATFLARSAFSTVPYNWHPLVNEGHRYHLVSLGLLGFQRWVADVLPGAVAPADVVGALVLLSGALLVPLAWLLVEELDGEPSRWVFVALVAVAPILWLAGISDCPHLLALMIWTWGALQWRDGVSGDPGGLMLSLLAALALSAVRIEAGAWVLGWFALAPPARSRPWAAVLAVGMIAFAFSGLAYYSAAAGHTSDFRPLPSVALLLFLPLHLPLGMTESIAGGLVFFLLLVIGARHLLRQNRGFALRMIAAMFLVHLVPALTMRPPVHHLLLRYSMPLAILALVFVAAGGARLVTTGPRWRSAMSGALLATTLLFETYRTFAPHQSLTFRQEFQFLADEVAALPAGSTMCTVDPMVVHTWEGRHNDFDVAFSLPEDGAAHYGFDVAIEHLDADLTTASQCDYYYESSLCNVALQGDSCFLFPGPNLLEDVGRFQTVCRDAHLRLGGRVVAEAALDQRIYWCFGGQPAPGPVDVRLFDVREEH